MSPDSLFDPDDYNAKPVEPAEAAPLVPDDALAFDRKTTLVPGDDGWLARQVALHSLDKAHYARYYADIVGTAMKNAWPGPLAWVELFAGPGRLYVKELAAFKPGSPVEATGIRSA